MKCPKCSSENVTIQAVSHFKSKGKGCLYWLFIGFWLEPIMWLFLTIPMIFIKMFGRKKVSTTVKSYAVCQSCGYKWQTK